MALLSIEYQSLYSLWNSTNGAEWVYPSNTTEWNFDGYHDPCAENWMGVYCDSVRVNPLTTYSTVTSLILYDAAMSGSIPSDISNLQSLEALNLGYNYLVGQIPTTIGLLRNLTELGLVDNYLTGALPTELLQMSNLEFLSVESNQLNSTIPTEIGQLDQMQYLELGINRFEGSLPTEIGRLTNLITFNVKENILTGELPTEIGLLENLVKIVLRSNEFVGTLPTEIGMLVELVSLDLYDTYLTGSIPSEIGLMTSLTFINFSGNVFSGSLDVLWACTNLKFLFLMKTYVSGPISSEISSLQHLQILKLGGNELTGPLPAEMSALSSLLLLDLPFNYFSGSLDVITSIQNLENATVNGNFFTGTFPTNIDALSHLLSLDVSLNRLHGTLPSSISNLQHLGLLNVSFNQFSGSLNDVFDATRQDQLQIIDVGNNQFTGSLPTELFNLKRLETLSTINNCFEGELPESICNASSILTLSLDASSSASACVSKIFPFFPAYQQQYHLGGSIPTCVFNLSSIQTLHLSGNSFSLKLTDDIVLSPSLSNLDLSHNSIRGEIPSSFCTQNWHELNLGFNKITGKLCDSMHVNKSLTLEVNRLSGRVGSSFLDIGKVSILSGNIFACDSEESQLPENDPEYKTYSCGSTSTNNSMYIYVSVTVAFVVVCLVFYRVLFPKKDAKLLVKEDRKSVLASETVTENNAVDFSAFELMCKGLIRSLAWLLPLFVVGVIVSTALHSKYTTYTDSYVWMVSFGLLSGVGAAVVMIFYQFVFAWVGYYILGPYQRALVTIGLERRLVSVESGKHSIDAFKKTAFKISYGDFTLFSVIFLTNLTVTIAANVSYVTSSLEASDAKLFFLQVALALFKLSWSGLIINILVSRLLAACLSGKNVQREANFRTTLNIVAILVAPCIATMVGSPNCFQYVFFEPSQIAVTYSYQYCDSFILTNVSTCTSDRTSYVPFSYTPTFSYSYQCSSSLMIAYSSVFMYQAIFSSYLFPLAKFFLRPYQRRLKDNIENMDTTTTISSIVAHVKLVVWLCLDTVAPLLDTSSLDFNKQIFKCYNPVSLGSNIVTFLVVAMTFGCVFPLLGLAFVVALIAQFAVIQMDLAYHINHCEQSQREALSQAIDDVYQDFSRQLVKSAPVCLGWSGLFMSFFVFDTLGDAIGGMNAFITVIVLLFVLGLSLFVLSKVSKPIAFQQQRNASNNQSLDKSSGGVTNDDFL